MSFFETLTLGYWIMVLVFSASAMVLKIRGSLRQRVTDSPADNVIVLQETGAERAGNQERTSKAISETAREFSNEETTMASAGDTRKSQKLPTLSAA